MFKTLSLALIFCMAMFTLTTQANAGAAARSVAMSSDTSIAARIDGIFQASSPEVENLETCLSYYTRSQCMDRLERMASAFSSNKRAAGTESLQAYTQCISRFGNEACHSANLYPLAYEAKSLVKDSFYDCTKTYSHDICTLAKKQNTGDILINRVAPIIMLFALGLILYGVFAGHYSKPSRRE